MAIRLTGMASGLDTESMITDLMSAYNGTKQKKVSNMTKYSWKMEAWSSLNKKINNFYSKALSNLRFSSSYSSKKTTVSDASKATVTASSGAVIGSQTLAIKQMAQSGYLTGGVLKKASDGSSVTEKSTLADLGYNLEDTTISVKSGEGGEFKSIKLTKDTKISELVNTLKNSGINASFDAKNQRIFVNSKSSGKEGDFQLIADNEKGIEALSKLGLYAGVTAGSEEYNTYNTWASMASDIDPSAPAGSRITAGSAAAAAYDKELTAKLDAYKQAAVDAKEKIDELDSTIREKSNILDGWTDAGGTHYKGSREELAESEIFTRASNRASQLLDTIRNRADLTDEQKAAFEAEKKEFGLDKLSEEDLDKVTVETLTDTALKIEGNKVAKQISETTDETEKAALQEKSKEIGELITKYKDVTTTEKELNKAQEEKAKQEAIVAESARYVNSLGEATDELKAATEEYVVNKIQTSAKVINGEFASDSSAVRLSGQNAQIYLNGAFFESGKNGFEINGLTINVTGTTELTESGKAKAAAGLETDASDYNTVSLTTSSDVDGIYKNIKGFIKEYNDLIKEMDTKYSADSASKYDVLTNEEKDAMSDTEVEAWEKKIKDSLLRRDDSLSGLIDAFKSAMQKTYEINGNKYSLSSFGIETMSYFLAPDGEKGVFHIQGDEDETDSSGENKLKAIIASNADDVQEFFTKLTNDMYNSLQKKASSSVNSSYGSFYEDKLMNKQYDTYKTQLSDYESKLQDIEDKYYKQFSAMETALTKLQSSTSAISGLLGMS